MFFRFRSPKQRYIRSYVSRQHFRHKEKEEGFPKGGTWVHLFGSVPEARPAQNQRLGKTNRIRTDYPDNNTSLSITAKRK